MKAGFRGRQNEPANSGFNYVVGCPNCRSGDRQIKIGKNPSGSQRLKCQHCGTKYTPPRDTFIIQQAIKPMK